MIQPTLYVRFTIYIWSNIIFNNTMIQIANIYVSTTVYLLQMIYISKCRDNSQHFSLANPDYNNVSIDNHKQEIFTTFMLAVSVYATR